MKKLIVPLSVVFLICAQFAHAAKEHANASHLQGISFLYMHIDEVDSSLANDIGATERLELSEIMELQLRRGHISLRNYILNQPELNVPLVKLSIKDAQGGGARKLNLILQVRDNVTIDRNKEQAVAVTFEMRRSVSISTSGVDAIKSELRGLMADFVAIFNEQNSK